MPKKATNHNLDADRFFKQHTSTPDEAVVKMNSDFSTGLEDRIIALHLDNISKGQSPASTMDKIKSLFSPRTLFVGGALSFVAIIVVAVAVFISNRNTNTINPDQQQTIAGEIVYLEGMVEYRDNDGGWFTADTGVSMDEGDGLRILGTGRAVLNLDDGSAVRLGTDSEVELTSLDPSHFVINNLNGVIYTRVAESERIFDVVAEDTTYRAMGTAYTTFNTDNKNGCEVFQSEVEVGSDVVVKEGNSYFVRNKDKQQLKKLLKLDKKVLKKRDFIVWNKEQDKQFDEYKEKLGYLDDLDAPMLKITKPVNGKITKDASITVKGKTETDAKVFVKGKQVETNNGEFSKKVNLKTGLNKINIKAIDASGNITVKYIKVTRQEENTADEETQTGLALYAQQVTGGIKLTWTVNGVDHAKGFKVLKSHETNPAYPNDLLTYLSDPETREYFVSKTNGKTYHFRICTYNGSGCSVYSNDASATAPGDVMGTNSIYLISTGEGVSWNVDGTAENGFKVMWWPKDTYPDGGEEYVETNSSANSHSWSGMGYSGEYKVKVCVRKSYSEGCKTYSNHVYITL